MKLNPKLFNAVACESKDLLLTSVEHRGLNRDLTDQVIGLEVFVNHMNMKLSRLTALRDQKGGAHHTLPHRRQRIFTWVGQVKDQLVS